VFIDNNPSISKSILSNVGKEVTASLVKLSSPEICFNATDYITYIASFVRLFAGLCKNRNQEVIDRVRSS
jgi:hypothetical protein